MPDFKIYQSDSKAHLKSASLYFESCVVEFISLIEASKVVTIEAESQSQTSSLRLRHPFVSTYGEGKLIQSNMTESMILEGVTWAI